MDATIVGILAVSLLACLLCFRRPARRARPVVEILMLGMTLMAVTFAIAFAAIARPREAMACLCSAAITTCLALRWMRAGDPPEDGDDDDHRGGDHPGPPTPKGPSDSLAIDWPSFDRHRAAWERARGSERLVGQR